MPAPAVESLGCILTTVLNMFPEVAVRKPISVLRDRGSWEVGSDQHTYGILGSLGWEELGNPEGISDYGQTEGRELHFCTLTNFEAGI